MVKECSDQELETILQSEKKPVLVDFWAEWCGPCRMLGPILQELAGEMADVVFVKINVDEHTSMASVLGIRSLPTLVLFRNGKPESVQVGALSKPQARLWIEEAAGL